MDNHSDTKANIKSLLGNRANTDDQLKDSTVAVPPEQDLMVKSYVIMLASATLETRSSEHDNSSQQHRRNAPQITAYRVDVLARYWSAMLHTNEARKSWLGDTVKLSFTLSIAATV